MPKSIWNRFRLLKGAEGIKRSGARWGVGPGTLGDISQNSPQLWSAANGLANAIALLQLFSLREFNGEGAPNQRYQQKGSSRRNRSLFLLPLLP